MASRGFTVQRSWAVQAKIGFLGATTPEVWSGFVTAFEQQLRQLGWINGGNIAIDYRWASGEPKRYAALAKGFVGRDVDIIVTSGTAAVIAAKNATKSIPIVFAAAGDPVRTGLVASLPHPGGNVTGLSNGATGLALRRLKELRKVVPKLQRLAIVGNQRSSVIRLEMQQVEKGARKLKIKTVLTSHIGGPGKIAAAIKKFKGKADAIFVCSDPLLTTHRVSINTAAASAGLPTLHANRDYVLTGGLMSYGPDFQAMFESAADIVDQILRGKKPAQIPVRLPKKCELYVNRSTAHALGLTIPKGVRGRAKVIH
jgi:putative tryptophan/tyrosine transport system substrate-binding protein